MEKVLAAILAGGEGKRLSVLAEVTGILGQEKLAKVTKAKEKSKETSKYRADSHSVRYDITRLTDDDLYLFNEGSHHRLCEKLGAHSMTVDGVQGVYFAVWAPNAEQVFVTGEFNGWTKSSHPLHPRAQCGIWEGFIPGIGSGTLYKHYIVSRHRGYDVEKADPFAFCAETPPKTDSAVWDLNYTWGDQLWMEKRCTHNSLDAPISIYEVHLGSWRRVPEEGNRSLTYRELASKLA